MVEESSDDPDYMMSEKGNRRGKVPKVFLDIES